MKEDIEEAQIVEETTSMVLSTEFEKPTLPTLLKKDESIGIIKGVRAKYADVVIADTKDKENYDKVVSGKRELRTSRLAFKNSVTENLLNPVKEYAKALKEDFDAILAEFQEGEDELDAKKTAIDDQKKVEKAAEDARKLKVFTERVQKLIELGGKPTDTSYVFDYDLTLSVKIGTLKDLDEDKWLKQLGVIETAHADEAKRVEDEKVANANALIEANALVAQNLVKQRQLRLKELKMEGFVPSILGEGIFEHPTAFPGKTIGPEEIDKFTSEQWDSMIIDYSGYEPPVVEEEEEDIPLDDEPVVPVVNTHAPSAIQPSVHFEEEIDSNDQPSTLVERTLVFSTEKPFIDVSLTGTLTQRLFPDEYRVLALEGLAEGTYQEGQVDESLLFVVFKK